MYTTDEEFEAYLIKVAFADTPFNKEEEMKLVKAAQQGDVKALRKLKYKLKKLKEKVIQDSTSNASEASSAALGMEADAALTNAIMTYDETKGALTTHVYQKIQGAIKNANNESFGGSHVPRPDRIFVQQISMAKSEAESEFGPNPTDEQIFSFLKGNTLENNWDQFQNAKRYVRKNYIGDAETSSGEGDSVQFKDMFAKVEAPTNDDFIARMQIDKLDQLAKTKLTPQEYTIVKRNRFDGEPAVAVALSVGISGPQLKKIINKWDEIVKKENPL